MKLSGIKKERIEIELDPSDAKGLAIDLIKKATGLGDKHFIDSQGKVCYYEYYYHGSPDKVELGRASEEQKFAFKIIDKIKQMELE